MQNLSRGPDPRAYWKQVVVATLVVLALPTFFVYGLQVVGLMRSTTISVVVAIAASVGVATAGSAYWTRHGRIREVVFGELMVWSWLRRMRAERQLKKVWDKLGFDQAGQESGTGMTPARHAEVLEELALTLEARDLYTHGHSRRVTRHAHMIAKKMGLTNGQAEKIRAAAAMHDVGKLNVPRAVLNKPGKLSDEEFELVKRHPADGADMVARLGDPEITAMIRHHHERMDGGGYPKGLAGDDIPLGARIIAVADTFDAITSSRPYRPARRHQQAITILKEESGRQLDAQAVDAFLSYYSGRRSIALGAFFTTALQRLLAALAGPIESASAATITQSAVAVAASAALGTSLVVPAKAERPPSRDGHGGARHALQAASFSRTTIANGSATGGAGIRVPQAGGSRHELGLPPGDDEAPVAAPGGPPGMAPVAEPSGATGDHHAGSPKEPDAPKPERKAKEDSDEAPELAPSEGDDATEAPSPTAEAPSDSQSGKKQRDNSGSGNSGSGSSGAGNSGSGNNSETQQLDESGSQSPKSGKQHG